MKLLEQRYDELDGVLPPMYAVSNLSKDNLMNLINVFSWDIFTGQGKKQADVIGRVYEYFITNFADTEDYRNGELRVRSSKQLVYINLRPNRRQRRSLLREGLYSPSGMDILGISPSVLASISRVKQHTAAPGSSENGAVVQTIERSPQGGLLVDCGGIGTLEKPSQGRLRRLYDGGGMVPTSSDPPISARKSGLPSGFGST